MSNFNFDKALNFFKKGDFKGALDNLDIFNENFDSLALQALIYFKNKNYKDLLYVLNTYPILSEYKFLVGLVIYGKIEERKEDWGPFENYNLGVFYFTLREYETSLKFFLKATEQKSDFIQAINNSSILFEILDKKNESFRLFNKVKGLNKKNSFIRFNSWFLENSKLYEESNSLLGIDESFFDLNLTLIINYLMFYFYATGGISKAIKLSDKFLSDCNYSKYIWHNRATIFHKIGNMTQATTSYVKAILNFYNIYTIYNMHIATIDILKYSPKKSIDRIISDYPNINLIYFYAVLFFIRNRDIEDAYFYIKKLCNIDPEPYLKFLKLFESSENMSIKDLLKKFALYLKEGWSLEYLFFVDKFINLKDPIFIFDYSTRINTYIWRIKDESIELRLSANEEKISKEILHEELANFKVNSSIKELKKLIEVYKEFRMNYSLVR